MIRGLLVIAMLAACGASSSNDGQLLDELRRAMTAQVSAPEISEDHSRLVERVVASDALQGMSRAEVEAAIGRGDACARHPRCREHEFDDDDWFYDVGAFGGVQTPLLIVGFDQHGRVDRTWNLRTH